MNVHYLIQYTIQMRLLLITKGILIQNIRDPKFSNVRINGRETFFHAFPHRQCAKRYYSYIDTLSQQQRRLSTLNVERIFINAQMCVIFIKQHFKIDKCYGNLRNVMLHHNVTRNTSQRWWKNIRTLRNFLKCTFHTWKKERKGKKYIQWRPPQKDRWHNSNVKENSSLKTYVRKSKLT